MILEVVSITETETVEEESGMLRAGVGAIGYYVLRVCSAQRIEVFCKLQGNIQGASPP